jgi:hypothetical protein
VPLGDQPTYNINVPNYNPPPNLANQTAEAWYQNTIVAHPELYDTSISKAQWMAWYDAGLWDSASGQWKSSKVDTAGKPITGTNPYNPDQCPDGTVAFGQNMCAPPGYKQQGATSGVGATSAGGGTKPAAPQRPMTLQDVLTNMFAQRSGIFGFDQGRTPTAGRFQGTFGVDQFGNPLPKVQNYQSKSLASGGLLWGSDLSDYQPLAGALTTQGGGPKPQPDPGQTFNYQMGLTGPSAGPVVKPLSNQIKTNAVNRSNPTNVIPFSGETSLQDVLTGSSMFGQRKKTSPLAQMLGAT